METEASAIVSAAVITGPIAVIATTAEQQEDDQKQQKQAHEVCLSLVTKANSASRKFIGRRNCGGAASGSNIHVM